jgi:hypothetical protein
VTEDTYECNLIELKEMLSNCDTYDPPARKVVKTLVEEADLWNDVD